MLILLPPSEGKAVGRRGRPLDPTGLSFPALADARQRVIDALVETSVRPDALAVLDAPAGAADAVAGNIELRTAPTLRVDQLYTGVLYDALGLRDLDTGARRRAATRLLVTSALFGLLRPTDRVPSYRLSMGVRLPGVGGLAAHWRPELARVIPDLAGRRGVVVDLRSSTYQAAWKPTGPLADRTVAIHVVRDGPEGATAVSHMAKHTRGLVARHLLATGVDPRTPDELAEVLDEAFGARLIGQPDGRLRRLEVVEPVPDAAGPTGARS